MIAVYIVIGAVFGIAVGWLAGRNGKAMAEGRLQALVEERKKAEDAAREEKARAEQYTKDLLARNEEIWQGRLDKMKEEMQKLASEQMESRQRSLQDNNRRQIGELLEPLREQLVAFRKSVDDSRTAGEVNKKELKDSFEHTLDLFRQMQQTAFQTLREETAKIGNEASSLTRALKRDTKKQGDWGEMILESLLESSGLEKDRHYFVQENVKDDEGNNLRPDVIVRFPEGRSVIIDSKVSLTAYVEAFETDDLSLKERRLKDHAKSVRRHVDELVVKKYDTRVSDAIGFVLMFIPNDQSYLSALEQDRDLSTYAFSKRVVIISPSNLMIALQLAYNLWQQDARNKNIDRIVQTASDLYDKVAGFSDTMEGIEKSISRLSDEFAKAKKQLYEGKGNIMGRVENLKKLGLTPKKQIKGNVDSDNSD